MTLFFYTILATLLYVLALPVLVYLRFKPKYKDSIPSRFFLKNNSSFEKSGIWFHACSLGEVRSILPLIEKITTEEINISVITQTGFKEASKVTHANIRYLPYEIFLPFWITKQKTLVVMEAELWPSLFVVAKIKGMKTILMNARVSDKSYQSYVRFGFLYRWIFRHIDVVFAQSQVDKQRLMELGAKDVRVSGNIKTFQQIGITKQYDKPKGKRVVILASTHENEEALILSHIELLKNDLLVVVPRHPERFERVELLLKNYAKEKQLTYSRISQNETIQDDVVLCDKMGELINLYAVCDVVILGGSFIDGIGGHNPLEPAFFGEKVISGPYVFNQKALFKCVENIVICQCEQLRGVFEKSDSIKNSSIINSGDISPLLNEILGNNNGKSV